MMRAALALARRSLGRTWPNPAVGCVIVKDGRIVARGRTQDGGRPHAEVDALNKAGEAARGATVYVTLEPCSHFGKSPPCADALVRAGVAHVVSAMEDPNPAVNGQGHARLREAGITVDVGEGAREAAEINAGFLLRVGSGRPLFHLKLASSLDGRIATASGESKWITGEEARAHAHLERARADMILVGRGTFEADSPRLDVRLPGLEDRSPRRALLTTGAPVEGWTRLSSPQAIRTLTDVNDLLVEGGAETAASFLAGDLVDRLLIYRAPILIGDGIPGLSPTALGALADAHGRWRLADTRQLGSDTLQVYERVRASSGEVGTGFPPG
jgi:diaminohydroxyphosphoribosylaminopyrimidine deaminase/5-amino-6-(5-phosphoribosylamino)uracil reductase